jgi:hypothetical protein
LDVFSPFKQVVHATVVKAHCHPVVVMNRAFQRHEDLGGLANVEVVLQSFMGGEFVCAGFLDIRPFVEIGLAQALDQVRGVRRKS